VYGWELAAIVRGYAPAAATIPTALAGVARATTRGLRGRSVCQSKARQRHAREAESEFLQRGAARDGLGHVLCEFIEFVVHTFPFGWFVTGNLSACRSVWGQRQSHRAGQVATP
jgi:hypothetical protein